MNKTQFVEQYSRLTAEWPRAYGPAKAEVFAREFGGHEYPFFKLVVDKLLMKFRYAPQVTDVWAVIAEVSSESWKKNNSTFKRLDDFPKYKAAGDVLPWQENKRRFGLLAKFIGNPSLQEKDPDWLRRNIWPKETKEESERKYAEVIKEDTKQQRCIR